MAFHPLGEGINFCWKFQNRSRKLEELREIDLKQGFKLGRVRLKVSKEKLISSAGLGTIIELFDSSPLSKEFARCLPERKSNNSSGSYRLALILLSSLLHGDDCLDDIEAEFGQNPSAECYFAGEIPVAKTFGDYLRDFSDENIKELSHFLGRMGFSVRTHLAAALTEDHRPKDVPHFSVDSTFHDQAGRKIEGCNINYEGRWGLNSEVVYDESGIAYAGTLLTGNAKPGVKGPELLNQVLSELRSKKIENPFARVAYVSGDSAYAFEEFITTCQAHHASFVIAARAKAPWQQRIDTIRSWQEWSYSTSDLLKWEKKKKKPPQRFLARWHWSPSWAPHLKFPIIIKKEWKEDDLFGGDAGSWKYHAVITNEDLLKYSYQEVYERYLARANMENFIKDAKMGFDAYHFPCLSMRANHAYLLFILIAQNLLRWVSLITKPNKPHYAKKLRRKFIFEAGKLVSHARQLSLYVSQKFKQEVEKLKEAWGRQPVTISPRRSSA